MVPLPAQDWEMINSLDFDEEITTISYDYQNNIYLGLESGEIRKYDSNGELSDHLTIPNQNAPALIEAQNPLKVFTFYKQNQEFVYQERCIDFEAYREQL